MLSLNKLATSNRLNLSRVKKSLLPDKFDEFLSLTSNSKEKCHLLGLDIGMIKCGVAISDEIQNTALPLEIVASKILKPYLESIRKNISISGFVIGLPLTLQGNLGCSSLNILKVVNEFADFINITNSPIWLHDERYTTIYSYSSTKSKKKSPKLVDDLCAMRILQEHLDLRKMRGLTGANGHHD